MDSSIGEHQQLNRMEEVMHGFNGYKVTRDGYSVTNTAVGFTDLATAKVIRVIKVDGRELRVTEQVEMFWLAFRRIDKEFANEMVRNYKVVLQLIQFTTGFLKLKRPDTLAHTRFGFIKLIEELKGRFRDTKIIGKKHTLTFDFHHDWTTSGRPVISFHFMGPWHTFNDWPLLPAASKDEPPPLGWNLRD